jgi:hypothetical protein
MNKVAKAVSSGILILLGWLSLGVGYAVPLGGHPFNTIVFLSGFVFIISGIVTLAIIVTKNRAKEDDFDS